MIPFHTICIFSLYLYAQTGFCVEWRLTNEHFNQNSFIASNHIRNAGIIYVSLK